MKTLETERLILRDWKESDAEDLYEYASIDGIGEMAGWKSHKNIEESKEIINRFINEGDCYAIVYKPENKVIGSLGIHNKTMDPEYKADIQREIGYVVSKAYWGMGIAPEAVKVALKYAFEDIIADVVWCGHFVENTQSKRVIEKNGFVFHKNGQYKSKQLNRIFDVCDYIMTRENYRKLQIT